MRLKYIQKNYLKYNKGKGFISGHVDALHAQPPAADLFTDVIVENVIEKTGCGGIIGTVSRLQADLNRSPDGENYDGVNEYRQAIKDILSFLGILDETSNMIIKPYLHLSFHGMKDTHYGPYAIEIGTLRGKSCSSEIREWFVDYLTKKCEVILPKIELVFDEKFVGHESVGYHRWGDGLSYQGYNQNFHSFQIEISRTLRGKFSTEISEIFAQMIDEFQAKFVDIPH